jgi:putative acetyltransferase
LQDYLIRQYVAEDLDAVMSCWEHANAVAHPFLTERFVSQVRREIPEVYLPAAETWVAVWHGRVVGFIALVGDEIGGLFVEPEFHGRGIGRALVDKARESREQLAVEVFELNTSGVRFYSRYGFAFERERRHDQTGDNVLCMQLGGTPVDGEHRA